jgi:hypothetical protein
MKTPSKHSRVVLVPATLLAFSLSALCPTAAQAQSPRPASEGVAAANSPQQPSQPASTLAANIDRQVSAVENLIIDVAEAMPEDKFNFTPESLKIPGSDYKGVLTFAGQIKHVAAGNYFIWSTVMGDKLAEGLFNDGKGPDNLKTKAEIIQFLKDSFALGHKAAATLTPENMLQGAGRSTRINTATFSIEETYNHYGQMVEYLRMNGIVPPKSRAKSD